MRILFMGTPQIAAKILRRLAEKQEVCGLFCQPDRPVGRRGALTPPPAKMAAAELGIPVFQPEKLRDGAAAALVRELGPELIAVVAYGRILPGEILDIPRYGCVNMHASLLPKYRGASPLQHALLNGDPYTGVTAMMMDEGLDTGDILASRRLDITDADDADSMYARAAETGSELLFGVISDILGGALKRTPQEGEASFAPPLTKEMGRFSFSDSARDIFNKVRALCRWPVAFFTLDGAKVKVHGAGFSGMSGRPGEVLSLNPLTVAANGGAVELISVTPEGRRTMSGRDFAAGRRIGRGDILPGLQAGAG
jgi:methionyl-tRNA formyltransferase